MSDQDEPKDHHFVPAFYLKGWVRKKSDKKLTEFKKLHNERIVHKHCSEKATGYLRYLYSKSTANPDIQDHSLESGFMKDLDNCANLILRTMLSNPQKMTSEQLNDWIKFIVVLMLRSPEEMKISSEKFWQILEFSSKEHEEWYRGVRGEQDPKTYLDLMRGLPNHEIETMQHDALVKTPERKKLVPFLCSLSWHIRKIHDSKRPLLTSDRPVFCNNRLSFPDGLLFMPLSPNTVLFAQPETAGPHPILKNGSDNETMRFCNLNIVKQAKQYVWTNDFSHEFFIKRYMGSALNQSFNEVALKVAMS